MIFCKIAIRELQFGDNQPFARLKTLPDKVQNLINCAFPGINFAVSIH